jgi:gluconolactonase
MILTSADLDEAALSPHSRLILMRRILPALLLVLLPLVTRAEDYALGPDSMPQPGVPKGTLTHLVLKPGRYYPGTPHNCSVYVPAEYDASRPTPFMIFLDGSQALGDSMRVPTVFDNLIAKHDLPVMIGIFIDPGVLPALSDQDQKRYNRIFEYDSLSGRLAEFLVNEVIPEVAVHVNLSKNPDDRGLSGVSTGAVGAFMAAWNRPDQFHRVLSFIGTFVAMKGADTLAAMVRKTEPKPIRIFLQDGTGDHVVPAEPFGTSFAGSWPINNQVMAQALEYSGYDVKLVMGSEGHNLKQGGVILPDALRWLWRGYPQSIVVREPPAMHQPGWDPIGKAFETVEVDRPWQQIEGDYHAPLQLTSDKQGNVYFAEAGTGQIDQIAPDGAVAIFRKNASGAASLDYGADGRLYAAEPRLRRIVSLAPDGDQKVVARNVAAVNLAVTQKGAIYYTDESSKTIGLVDPQGRVRVAYGGDGMAIPAGIALSPDQAFVIVSDAQSRFSWSFQIEADGSLINGEPFYRLEMPEEGWMSHAVGVREDTSGQIYFATPLGIQVCMPNGRVEEILNAPQPGALSSLSFATGNPEWLYVVEFDRIYRRPVKVTGAHAWTVLKPPKPTL